MYVYIRVVDPPRTVVELPLPALLIQITFTTLNWVTNHMISDLLGTLNIEGPVGKYFSSIAILCILRSNHLTLHLRWSNLPASPLVNACLH